MFVLIVSVKVKSDMRDVFLKEIEDNSIATVRDEPGCLRFDVVQNQDDPDRYYLYEVYVDEDAYAAHTRTPHLARWRQAAAECLAERKLTNCTMIFSRQ